MAKPGFTFFARAAGVSLALIAAGTQAQAAEPSDFSLSANMSLASQYRYRGLMQTDGRPAIQGGFDLTHSSGFYIGNWNSTISWLGDSSPDVSAPVEMDIYGGYTAKVWGDLSVDVGVLHYHYPGRYPDGYTSPNTTEGYVGFGYGPVKFKYSHAFSDLFGVPGSRHSQYYDLSGSFPTGVWGLDLNAHVGYQQVRNLDDGAYTDWSLGVSKTFNDKFTVALAYVDTDAKRSVYTSARGRYLGGAAAVLTVTARF